MAKTILTESSKIIFDLEAKLAECERERDHVLALTGEAERRMRVAEHKEDAANEAKEKAEAEAPQRQTRNENCGTCDGCGGSFCECICEPKTDYILRNEAQYRLDAANARVRVLRELLRDAAEYNNEDWHDRRLAALANTPGPQPCAGCEKLREMLEKTTHALSAITEIHLVTAPLTTSCGLSVLVLRNIIAEARAALANTPKSQPCLKCTKLQKALENELAWLPRDSNAAAKIRAVLEQQLAD